MDPDELDKLRPDLFCRIQRQQDPRRLRTILRLSTIKLHVILLPDLIERERAILLIIQIRLQILLRDAIHLRRMILIIHIRRHKHRRICCLLQARVTGKAIPEVHRKPRAAEKDRDQYCENTMYAPRSFLSAESRRCRRVIISPRSEAMRNKK